ncbi:MAG: hypothetical protein K1X65_04720 [Caldilineales bacterium]|nr:hypothetical protein [Caldilineales bacterium]MCW5859596.1 hypothetical protein [Caldilineales bacterium]
MTPLVRGSEAFFRALLWLLAAHSVFVWAVALVDWIRHPLALSPYNAFNGHPLFRGFALFVGAPVVAFLGYLILKRQRQNLVGLLLLVWAGGLAAFGVSVAIHPLLLLLVSLPGAAWWMALIFAPFYFPDGHAYPRWLSPVLPAIMVFALLFSFVQLTLTPQLPFTGEPTNPFFIPGSQAIAQILGTIFTVLMPPLIIGVFLSPLLRYRRASAVQRQQIKAFAFWSAIVLTPYLVFYVLLTSVYPERSAVPPALQAIAGAFIGLIGLFPPIIIAYSILRYRLFDIDIIIRKTLQYTAVTALLSIIYFGSVFLLQRLFSNFTGQQSPLILVVSTLLIAALFAPLRRRIQDGIDRRFRSFTSFRTRSTMPGRWWRSSPARLVMRPTWTPSLPSWSGRSRRRCSRRE